ncbi:MAG: conjugal transfer protein TraB [Pseudomonadota bacterium]
MMKQEDELVLKVTKDIVIKLIEMGRLSVGSFDEVFKQIHSTIYESLMQKTLSIDDTDEFP